MKPKCYINGMGCISAQNTLKEVFLENPIVYKDTNTFPSLKEDFKSVISPGAIRRMSTGVKNSVLASHKALEEAKVSIPDAVIVGTGLGCVQDTEKFLNRMIENDEQYLTPTSFIQSTHNTVAGQIALNLKCTAYNFTYVNSATSFPSAILDGLMLIQESQEKAILVGGIDELAENTTALYREINWFKKPEDPFTDILSERTEASAVGEAAAFFTLSNKLQESTYAAVQSVDFIQSIKVEETQKFVQQFLEKNQLTIDEIDTIVLGNSGQVDFDDYYDEVESLLEKSTPVYYKHLFGDYFTSSAVSLWIGAKILKEKKIPSVLLKEGNEKNENEFKNILIYNHFRGKGHSLILLKNV